MTSAVMNAGIWAFTEFVHHSARYVVVISGHIIKLNGKTSLTTNIAPWAFINQRVLLTKYNGHNFRLSQNMILSR